MPPGPTVLAFHKLSPRFSYGSTNYSPIRFRRLLRYLVDSGRQFAPCDSQGENLCLSFDDGYQHLVDVLPQIIDEFKFRPVVFIPTAWIGRANTWDYSYQLRSEPHLDSKSIRALSQGGVDFGSHGHSHSDLTSLSDAQLAVELTVSRSILQDLTGGAVKALSYPFGRWNERVIEAAGLAGYETAFTMQFPAGGEASLARGRVPIYGYDTPLSIRHKLAGSGALYRLERLKAGITNKLSGGTVLLNRLRTHRPG